MLRRSSRVIRKPVLYQPVETVLEDDYAADEYDSDLDVMMKLLALLMLSMPVTPA